MTATIKLAKTSKAHGPEVTLEEFLTWNARKQARNLIEYPSNKGNPAWNRGQAWSDEVKKNISLSRIGNPILKSRGPRSAMSEEDKAKRRETLLKNAGCTIGKRIVISPEGTFPSMRAWADATGITTMTLRKWTKVYPDEYKLVVDHTPKVVSHLAKRGTPENRANISRAKKCDLMTPTGRFASIKAAGKWAREHGLKNADNLIRVWLETHPQEFYYVPKEVK